MMQDDTNIMQTMLHDADLNMLLARHDIAEDLLKISDVDKGSLDHILTNGQNNTESSSSPSASSSFENSTTKQAGVLIFLNIS